MEIIQGTTDFQLNSDSAVAIGKFDGVHIGHRKIIAELLARKEQGLTTCVFTFDPAPSVLFGSDVTEITTRDEKRLLFERLGVDVLLEFPMNYETAGTDPEVFVREYLAGKLRARVIVAGDDLSFGAGGRGNTELLASFADELGFTVQTMEKVRFRRSPVSSTRIRKLLGEGKMEEVNRLLGEPYFIEGKVVQGNKLGRTIGFPTVNILPGRNKQVPPYGVYFSEVVLDGRKYPAITNIGCKPTVSEEKVCGAETFIYDFNDDIYGKRIQVRLLTFVRPEKIFESVDALKRQLDGDIASGREYFSRRK